MKKLIMSLALMALSFSAVADTGCEPGQSETINLEEAMERTGELFQDLRRAIVRGNLDAEALAMSAEINQLLYISLPMGAQIKALDANKKILYKKLMADTLAESYALEEAILMGAADLAKTKALAVNEKRKEAHDIFDPED